MAGMNPMALAGFAVMSGKPLGDALIEATKTVQEQQYRQQQMQIQQQQMALQQLQEKRMQQAAGLEAKKLAMQQGFQQRFLEALGGGAPMGGVAIPAAQAPAADYSAPGGMSLPGEAPAMPLASPAAPQVGANWPMLGLMGEMGGLDGAGQFASAMQSQQNRVEDRAQKLDDRNYEATVKPQLTEESKNLAERTSLLKTNADGARSWLAKSKVIREQLEAAKDATGPLAASGINRAITGSFDTSKERKRTTLDALLSDAELDVAKMKLAGTGPITENERMIARKTLPQLGSNYEANKAILDNLDAQAVKSIQTGKDFAKFKRETGGTIDDFMAQRETIRVYNPATGRLE